MPPDACGWREVKRIRASGQLSRMITMPNTVEDMIDLLLSFKLMSVSCSAPQGRRFRPLGSHPGVCTPRVLVIKSSNRIQLVLRPWPYLRQEGERGLL